MAVWKYKLLSVTDHPTNDRMSLAVVRFRRYVDQPAADADPNVDAVSGFQFSWDSKTNPANGPVIVGDNIGPAYIDTIAPNIIASLEAKIAARALLDAAVGVVKTGTPAAQPAPDNATDQARAGVRRLVQLQTIKGSLADVQMLAKIKGEMDAIEAALKTYFTNRPAQKFTDLL